MFQKGQIKVNALALDVSRMSVNEVPAMLFHVRISSISPFREDLGLSPSALFQYTTLKAMASNLIAMASNLIALIHLDSLCVSLWRVNTELDTWL